LLEGVPMSGSDGTRQPGRQTYTKEHLANFKTPRSVAFLETLPGNPGGKVVKPAFRASEATGKTSRASEATGNTNGEMSR
jgi:acyl-coenzyme A synthetase/AMP-(fatty) acid ligase